MDLYTANGICGLHAVRSVGRCKLNDLYNCGLGHPHASQAAMTCIGQKTESKRNQVHRNYACHHKDRLAKCDHFLALMWELMQLIVRHRACTLQDSKKTMKGPTACFSSLLGGAMSRDGLSERGHDTPLWASVQHAVRHPS